MPMVLAVIVLFCFLDVWCYAGGDDDDDSEHDHDDDRVGMSLMKA